LANTKQAEKRVRQNETKRQHNASRRSAGRTAIKKVVKALNANQVNDAVTAYAKMVPLLDRMAAHGYIHKNKAARHKSRLSRRLSQVTSTATAAA
jgi:small subunit ribosomal protein S20